MSQQFPKAEVYKELGTKIFCRNKNKTAGSKLCRDIIKVCRDRIQEKAQRTGRDRKLQAATKTKDSVYDITFYVVTERPIWARYLGIHNTVLKCGPTLESL